MDGMHAVGGGGALEFNELSRHEAAVPSSPLTDLHVSLDLNNDFHWTLTQQLQQQQQQLLHYVVCQFRTSLSLHTLCAIPRSHYTTLAVVSTCKPMPTSHFITV